MRYERAKYEELIRGSPLFEIDREHESVAYRREFYKMIEYLYCYLMAVNERKFEPFGTEIVDVATRCISNYNPSNGFFLNYFVASWKREYSHIIGESIIDEKFHGMRLVEEDKRNIRRYLKLVKQLSSISEQDLYERIAEAMHISIEKVICLAQMSSSVILNSATVSEGDEEINIIEQIADDITIEQMFENAESLSELLAKIDIVFDSLQDRQKALISDMLTIKVGSILVDIIESGKQYHFISQDILHAFNLNDEMPTQRQIAEKYGRDEASVSRSIKDFINKIKTIIHKE